MQAKATLIPVNEGLKADENYENQKFETFLEGIKAEVKQVMTREPWIQT